MNNQEYNNIKDLNKVNRGNIDRTLAAYRESGNSLDSPQYELLKKLKTLIYLTCDVSDGIATMIHHMGKESSMLATPEITKMYEKILDDIPKGDTAVEELKSSMIPEFSPDKVIQSWKNVREFAFNIQFEEVKSED